MAGLKALRKIQFGPELVAGDATGCTQAWRGLGTMEDQRTVAFADEDVAIMQDTNRAYVPKLQAAITWDSVPATFEQLPYVFNAGIKLVTASVSGSGCAYIYPVATTSANAIQTYTIEAGDNQQATEMEYSFVKSFTLDGKAGEAWMVTADWIGRQVADCTYTAGVSLVTVEEMLFSKSTLYIDPVATIGNTTQSNTMLSATLAVPDTGNVPVFTADNALYFSYQKQQRPGDQMTLAVTFEHNASSETELAAYRAKTPRGIRIKTLGTALATAALFTNKTMIIDAYGVWSKFDKLGEQDGNDIVVGTLRIGYNATSAKALEITVVNEVAAL